MEDLLIETVEELGYPVRLQGSLLEDEPYPKAFFTYWNDEANGDGFYSNDETRIVWAYSLNFYSTDPELVSKKLLEAKRLLKEKGFIVTGAGFSVPTDEADYVGRGIDIYYMEEI